MNAKTRISGLILLGFLAAAGTGFAQVTSIEGDVKAADGSVLKGAMVKIDRKDIKGHYQVKTDKKGHFYYGGLPLGVYKVTLEVDDKVADSVDNIHTQLGDPTEVPFNLKQSAAQAADLQKAVASGTVTKEQERQMSPEQKAAIEKQAKETAAAMAKNKALNDAFNAGKQAEQAKDWQAAATAYEKASELDPNQLAVWTNLASSYTNLAATKTGAEQQAVIDKALTTWQKAISMKPDDAGFHNNYGLALAKAKKFQDAETELGKAAQLDPPGAGKYYFNLGAVLVNTGQSEQAIEAFKKAIAADPKYAPAQYQYGISLMSKATTAPDGKVIPPPGAVEAFQQYLVLAPTGPDAESAKGMLATLQGSVQTKFENPDAVKRKKKN